MTTTNSPTPAAFTNDDFAARMSRVASSAAEKGLAGVIVTPGPDLVWLTGYRPTAITERLTMLVRQQMTGAKLTHLPTPPGAIPVKLDFESFEIERSGAEWEAIVASRNLSAYVPTDIAGASLEAVFLLAPRA